MLDAVDGDSYVTMRLGNSSEYRDRCSKIQLMAGDTLEIMIPTRVEIEENGDGGFHMTIVLEEGGWSCEPVDNGWADEFDKRFGPIEKCDSGVAVV